MKIHILSDLHIEFSDFQAPETDADVVVLAGDIGKHTHGLKWAIDQFHHRREESHRPEIIYIGGNHEFYGAEIHGIRRELKSAAESARHEGVRVWVLDDSAVEIDGVRFLHRKGKCRSNSNNKVKSKTGAAPSSCM